MTPFLITFRETVEIVFVIAALYGIIIKINAAQLKKYLWLGVLSGVGLSIVFALVFKLIFGELNEELQEAVEIGASVVGILMITMTVLMFESLDHFHKFILRGVDKVSERFADWWVFVMVFLTIIRDGVETIIFLFGSNQSVASIFWYGSFGILAAVILGVAFYRGMLMAPAGYFFKITNILLLFFASSLFSRIFEEMQMEVGAKFGTGWSQIFAIGMYLVYFVLFGVVYKIKKLKQIK
jgi:high-affinity iron transporter